MTPTQVMIGLAIAGPLGSYLYWRNYYRKHP